MNVEYKEFYQLYPRVSPYILHKSIWKLFPGVAPGERPFIYRFDEVGGKMLVNVRTIAHDMAADNVKTIDQALVKGEQYDFSVRIVPKVCKGRRVIHLPKNEAAGEWFKVRTGQYGFVVRELTEANSRGRVFYGKHGRKITLNDTVISGKLEIGDEARFAQSLLTGIGPHRGFGFGLLQLN